MDSNFDPTSFLGDTITGQMDTKITPVPAGGPYPAVITKVAARQFDGKKDPTKTYTSVDVTFEIDDATARQATGLDHPTVRMNLFLDLTAQGKLDTSKGKNVQLGRLREALGLNDPNRPFSFNDLLGRACMVEVDHRPNDNSPGDFYANISKVQPNG